MSADWMIGVCGLNCARCDIYRASHGDDEGRLAIQRQFKEKRGLEVPLDKIGCDGCRCPPEKNWSDDCAMQRCATEKGHIHCSECGDFVCDKLKAFAADGSENHMKTVENLKEMRHLGLKEWVRRQPSPSFCP